MPGLMEMMEVEEHIEAYQGRLRRLREDWERLKKEMLGLA